MTSPTARAPATARAPIVIDAHGKHAQAVVFTKSGRTLFSCGQDKAVRIWHAPKFAAGAVFTGHLNCVNSLSLDADEKRLATSSTDKTVRVWSVSDGKTVQVLKGQVGARYLPDGKRLLTLDQNGALMLWHGEEVVAQYGRLQPRVFAFAPAPDGATFVTSGPDGIQRVDVGSGKVVGSLAAYGVPAIAVAFAPGGKTLATSGADGVVKLWSWPAGAARGSIVVRRGACMQLAFAPTGDRVVIGTEGALQIFRVKDGALLELLPVGVKGVYGVAWSKNGKWIANAAADGRVRVWEVG